MIHENKSLEKYHISQYDYTLPKELIAQTPVSKRDRSRLLILHSNTGSIFHRVFYELPEFLNPGDLLVLNNTKVISARIIGITEEKIVELLLINRISEHQWEGIIRPKKVAKKTDTILVKDSSIKLKISKSSKKGRSIIELPPGISLDSIGVMPLPPYIKRNYRNYCEKELDQERYQTIFAEKPGAIAAPTAGLHFTEELLQQIKEKGVSITYITLHTGIGTFKPIRTEEITQHKMESEFFTISEETANLVNSAKRIIAVGTTTVRALESVADEDGKITPYSGYTNLYIYPPYRFKCIDALITNFHLPKSTLLVLVSAFAGRELIMKAYKEAIERRYRFYSYGDAMLIL